MPEMHDGYRGRLGVKYIVKYWRGELSVAQAYWASGLLRGLLCTLPVILMCDFLAANMANIPFGELITQKGFYGFAKVHKPAIFWLFLILDTPSYLWWAVGIWRTCNTYNVEQRNKFIRFIVKCLVVIGYIALAVDYFLAVFLTIHALKS